jgi:hypothetical protein
VFGAANANSFATTINGNAAQAKSTAIGSGGQAQATAQTNFGSFQSVQSTSTSPLPVSTSFFPPRARPMQSHRPEVSFLFPMRSLQGRVFRSLVDQALVL